MAIWKNKYAQLGVSAHQHVRSVLEVGELHNEVVLHRQRIDFERASRTPRARGAPALPLKCDRAICDPVSSEVSALPNAREPQHERAIVVEDESRVPGVLADSIRQFTVENEGPRWPRQGREI